MFMSAGLFGEDVGNLLGSRDPIIPFISSIEHSIDIMYVPGTRGVMVEESSTKMVFTVVIAHHRNQVAHDSMD
jgi:hypothetical protein